MGQSHKSQDQAKIHHHSRNEYGGDPYSISFSSQSLKDSIRKLSDLPKAIAKYSFKALKEKDLSFDAGDEILIKKRRNNGWWVGYCHGKKGYFPHNYVNFKQGELNEKQPIVGENKELEGNFLMESFSDI